MTQQKPTLSLWEQQSRILRQNLVEVIARDPRSVNRHVLECIEHHKLEGDGQVLQCV